MKTRDKVQGGKNREIRGKVQERRIGKSGIRFKEEGEKISLNSFYLEEIKTFS